MGSNLSTLFHPSAITVVGATAKPHRVGHVVMRNLLAGGFGGPIMPVNPKYRSVSGVWTYPDVAALPATPDLAIVCSPPATVPDVIEQLARRGTKAAIVLTELDDAGRARLSGIVKESGLRILGDASFGVLVPRIGLNASFAHTGAQKGKVAFVSQSGALCAAVLDWAESRGIGFSHFVSLGSSLDVDFGDVMDYLANDTETRAILLHVEDLRERRNFMSAGRAAARNKPVLVVKGNRFSGEDDITAALASGSLATPDEIFDAAVRRAGMLRVNDVDELFAAFETLARARPIPGDRLAILTNAGGTGTMAVDALLAGGGRLAQLSTETIEKLDRALGRWSRGNPAEIPIDAPAKRYSAGLTAMVEASEADAVLVMHAPNALIEPELPARAVVEVVRGVGGRVLTSWVGGAGVAESQRIFAQAGIPTYDTPGSAVRAFLHMANYRRNQELLMQTPPSALAEFRPATGAARRVIDTALAAGRDTLTEPEAKAVLAAYGFAVVETHLAANAAEAAQTAAYLGFPVALTIQAPGLTRKWDVGGVALNLETREAVASAASAMVARLEQRRPGVPHQGFAVQRMVSRQNTRQLILGVATDRIFGPVILFGEGGRAVEIIRDHAIGLPPLNPVLAQELIGRTRIARLLGAYLDRPAADQDAICQALLRVSQMIVDLPEMVELDINPLFADDKGATVVDAHMKVRRYLGPEGGRLAIRPYPAHLEEPAHLKDGRAIVLRPIRPEDQPAHHRLLASLTPEDLRFRFFGRVGDVSKGQMARFTQIDYDREMAFIASLDGETLGAVRTVTDAENRRAELAITLRPDMRGTGLAMLLMEKMIRYHRDQGTGTIAGEILTENLPMQKLAKKAGFTLKPGPDGDTYEMLMVLR